MPNGRVCDAFSTRSRRSPRARPGTRIRPALPGSVDSPLGRTGRAEGLAAVVAFALPGDAGFPSGTDLLVVGGVWAAMSTETGMT